MVSNRRRTGRGSYECCARPSTRGGRCCPPMKWTAGWVGSGTAGRRTRASDRTSCAASSTRSCRWRSTWVSTLGARLDARSDLRSLHEVVEPPPEPPEGWGADVIKVEGRPVRPLGHSPVQERRPRAASAAVSVRSPSSRVARRGPSRERRARTRGASSASRDGPSDESEGDGEGPHRPPSPVTSHAVVQSRSRPLPIVGGAL